MILQCLRQRELILFGILYREVGERFAQNIGLTFAEETNEGIFRPGNRENRGKEHDSQQENQCLFHCGGLLCEDAEMTGFVSADNISQVTGKTQRKDVTNARCTDNMTKGQFRNRNKQRILHLLQTRCAD